MGASVFPGARKLTFSPTELGTELYGCIGAIQGIASLKQGDTRLNRLTVANGEYDLLRRIRIAGRDDLCGIDHDRLQAFRNAIVEGEDRNRVDADAGGQVNGVGQKCEILSLGRCTGQIVMDRQRLTDIPLFLHEQVARIAALDQ